MKELEDMTAAEISLAFARDVAGIDLDRACMDGEIMDYDGYPVCTCGWQGGRSDWEDTTHKKHTPDYVNDWNATIAAVEAKGWMFNILSGSGESCRDALVRTFHGRGEFDEPCAIALCRAAIKCARAEVEK